MPCNSPNTRTSCTAMRRAELNRRFFEVVEAALERQPEEREQRLQRLIEVIEQVSDKCASQ